MASFSFVYLTNFRVPVSKTSLKLIDNTTFGSSAKLELVYCNEIHAMVCPLLLFLFIILRSVVFLLGFPCIDFYLVGVQRSDSTCVTIHRQAIETQPNRLRTSLRRS